MANAMTRCEPFTGVSRWNETLDRFFNDFWAEAAEPARGLLAPAVDVSEDESSLRISAELPGLERKDIDLSVKDGVLVLRGEKRMEEERKEGRFHRVERRYGSFYRALALPDTVDAGKVDARFRNGVIEISLPKRPESKPRAIEIQG